MQLANLQLEMVLVFFVYGLAFFSMGIALSLEAGRSPLLVERRVLRPLALFGLVHGAHEWMEVILLQGVWLGLPFPAELTWLRVILLNLSFIPLVLFGILSLSPKRRLQALHISIFAGLLLLNLVLIAISAQIDLDNLAARMDALARYLLAIPGGLLAGLGLLSRARQVGEKNHLALGSYFRWAALGFGLYGLTQFFVPAVDIFPANSINAGAFHDVTGLPVQVVRGSMAVLITVNLIRAVQAADGERSNQLISAQKARVEALEQVQRELIERENLRWQLLRHTVIAQEDERARIARELHDQTAQELTAFSLNLATLRNSLPDRSDVIELVSRLQELSKQMSQGLYRLVRDLRPAQLDDLGLVPALKYLADEGRELFDLAISIQIEGHRQRLDPLIETVIFRVAQEALSNVSRHAGTGRAHLDLVFHPGSVILRISDQGVGFDLSESLSPPRGWGLAGMQERVESLGGGLHIDTSPGKGTTVVATILLSIDSWNDQDNDYGRRILVTHQSKHLKVPSNERLSKEVGNENHSSYAGR